MGYGKDYLYPHKYPNHLVEQEYLPPQLKGKIYYQPSNQGFERIIQQRLDTWRRLKQEKDG